MYLHSVWVTIVGIYRPRQKHDKELFRLQRLAQWFFQPIFLMFNITKEFLLLDGHSYANLAFLILSLRCFSAFFVKVKDVFPCFHIWMCACCVTQIMLTPAWPGWLHFSFSSPQNCVALCFRWPLRFCSPFLWDCTQPCGKNTPARSRYCTAYMCFISFTVFCVPESEGYWFWAVPLLGFWYGETRQRRPLPQQRAGRPMLSLLGVSPPCDCLQFCERCIRRIRPAAEAHPDVHQSSCMLLS